MGFGGVFGSFFIHGQFCKLHFNSKSVIKYNTAGGKFPEEKNPVSQSNTCSVKLLSCSVYQCE